MSDVDNAAIGIPLHGGDLSAASRHYGVERNAWLDLSTGINPRAYPIPDLVRECFQQLPYELPEFSDVVEQYYGRRRFIAGNGTQSFIRSLPALLPDFSVLLPDLGYQEHEYHWKRHRRSIKHYPSIDAIKAAEEIEKQLIAQEPFHLLLINPNNPSGVMFQAEQIIEWASRMSTGAYIVVDEAFIDTMPEKSLLETNIPENVIVLRSFGKFFGLAGIRLGFCFSNNVIQAKLKSLLGPWEVNGPAQNIAVAALKDRLWQDDTRCFLNEISDINRALLEPLFDSVQNRKPYHCPLFSTYFLGKSEAKVIFDAFAKQGVLLRLMSVDDNTSLIRIGRFDTSNHEALGKLNAAIGYARCLF